jgi:hypothetical protein
MLLLPRLGARWGAGKAMAGRECLRAEPAEQWDEAMRLQIVERRKGDGLGNQHLRFQTRDLWEEVRVARHFCK